ncbi:MAG TPA: hypothetical protein VK947_12645 [Planococcus sp. (in: firmicutes)]|nr:hypothetical protein [Planococcus sp. (in: firmicutes)]
MVKNENEETAEAVETEEIEETGVQQEEKSRFDKIYSNVASNRFENLRTSHIENRAKELAKKRR